MKKEENTVNFDLSVLSLSELVNLYEKIISFNSFLEDAKIPTEEKDGGKK